MTCCDDAVSGCVVGVQGAVGDDVFSRALSTSLHYQPLSALRSCCCHTFRMWHSSPVGTELIVAPHK